MKTAAEMNEGPEALQRFENTMKALFSKKKAEVLPEKKKPVVAKENRTSASSHALVVAALYQIAVVCPSSVLPVS